MESSCSCVRALNWVFECFCLMHPSMSNLTFSPLFWLGWSSVDQGKERTCTSRPFALVMANSLPARITNQEAIFLFHTYPLHLLQAPPPHRPLPACTRLNTFLYVLSCLTNLKQLLCLIPEMCMDPWCSVSILARNSGPITQISWRARQAVPPLQILTSLLQHLQHKTHRRGCWPHNACSSPCGTCWHTRQGHSWRYHHLLIPFHWWRPTPAGWWSSQLLPDPEVQISSEGGRLGMSSPCRTC